MIRKKLILGFIGLVCFAWMSMQTAYAHHSSARFNQSQTVTLKGTVRTVEWKNPHIWLWVWVTEVDGEPVADENGEPVVWGLESIAPGELLRSKSGWKRNTLQQGDKVTVTGHPLTDGRPAASLGSITLDDGTVIHGSPAAN